jgi:hypothetical protein
MSSIKDVEQLLGDKFVQALGELNLMPAHYRCKVRLHGKSRDKRRTASFEGNWHPKTDSVRIRFERVSAASSEVAADGAGAAAIRRESPTTPVAAEPISDLIRALDRAESRPGYDFVALKWFRDTALEDLLWASDPSARRRVLSDAIDRRLILTSKVPNPKAPQFPVTAIRLNRLMPEVSEILGRPAGGQPSFQPMPIRGENLSATVLRDRR